MKNKIDVFRYGFFAVVMGIIITSFVPALMEMIPLFSKRLTENNNFILTAMQFIWPFIIVLIASGFIMISHGIIPFFITGILSASLYSNFSFKYPKQAKILIPLIVTLVMAICVFLLIWFSSYKNGMTIKEYFIKGRQANCDTGYCPYSWVSWHLWIIFPVVAFLVSFFIIKLIKIIEE